MKIKKYRYFVGDFETTVYEGQEYTEVWASACVELYSSEAPLVFHSIGEQFDYLKSVILKGDNVIIYYHNLKYDGSFWLAYLINELGMKQAYNIIDEETKVVEWLKDSDMPNNTFKYTISDMGQWYNIIIKIKGHYIEMRDSLKLLPFSVKRIGESFGTKHKKLEMEYKGYRYAGCEITPEEISYIQNDVLVVKEALEIMYNEGHTELTIGACCMKEYKRLTGKEEWETLFPDLTAIEIDKNTYGASNVDEYVRKSYRGGWCYLVPEKANQIKTKGTTADVNSLYPSMMSSESGNAYPTGKPTFWKGDYIPNECFMDNRYFFVRIRTRFYIKKDKLPFIQVKNSHLYRSTEMLETSDYFDKALNKYVQFYEDERGMHDTSVTMTLTCIDYQLLKDHYNLINFEILDGCWFYSAIGIFDYYIDKYKKIKMESKGAIRELAKLFLNNLYGKMASSKISSFKVAYLDKDGTVGYYAVEEHNKKAGYIAVGSAITSYARNFTIRTAQENYYGYDKAGFIYADTDSIHCDLQPEEIKGIKVDDNAFCCWKLESCWDKAIFVRQKTYIEHITHENLKEIEAPYYNVKCAGMPDRCKKLFVKSMTGIKKEEEQEYTQEQLDFIKQKRTLKDFKIGLKITGKLLPLRIVGGTILVETTYEMR